MARLRWRLFDFGRVEAQVDQARGANRQAMLRATEDVENAIVTLTELASQAQSLGLRAAADQRSVGTARHAVPIAQAT